MPPPATSFPLSSALYHQYSPYKNLHVKSPLRIVFNRPKSTLQGWEGLSLHFVYGQSENHRLEAEGEPGGSQVSVSRMESLCGVYPSPTSAPGGAMTRMRPSDQQAQQTSLSEGQAHLPLWVQSSDQQPHGNRRAEGKAPAALPAAYSQDGLSTATSLLPFP